MSWTTSWRRLGIAGLTGALALGGSAAFATTTSQSSGGRSAAASTGCGEELETTSRSDIDGDGEPDVVIGVPNVGEGSGAVDVRGTNTPWQRLTSGMLGGSQDDNDQVGTAIAIADLDRDGCSDLIVGAPGEGSGKTGDYSGQVHIAFGSPTGIDTSSAFVIPTTAQPFDRFGAALALQARGNGHDLYVGAPEATVKGKTGAGQVYRYSITPGGKGGRVTVTAREVRNQDTAGVPGTSKKNDHFGSVLAAVDNGPGVLVGVPDKDVGKYKNAGMVWFLPVNSAGKAVAAQNWSQNSAGVAGKPQAGDRFGESVSATGWSAAIGIPGEKVSGHKKAGQVQLLKLKNGKFTPTKAITQATKGIPGNPAAGDRFGAQVAVGVALLCQEYIDVAIGAPGKDVGKQKDAGTITLMTVEGPGTTACKPKVVRQGSGLADKAETGDQVGSVLAISRGRTDLDEDYYDRLLIGVPYESIGTQADAGLVQPLRGGIKINGKLVATLKYPEGYLKGDHYGYRLSSSAN